MNLKLFLSTSTRTTPSAAFPRLLQMNWRSDASSFAKWKVMASRCKDSPTSPASCRNSLVVWSDGATFQLKSFWRNTVWTVS